MIYCSAGKREGDYIYVTVIEYIAHQHLKWQSGLRGWGFWFSFSHHVTFLPFSPTVSLYLPLLSIIRMFWTTLTLKQIYMMGWRHLMNFNISEKSTKVLKWITVSYHTDEHKYGFIVASNMHKYFKVINKQAIKFLLFVYFRKS